MKIKAFLYVIPLLFIVCGCQDDRKRIDEICTDLTRVSKMTDDCQKMAKNLATVTERFKKMMARLENNVPDASEQTKYFDSMSVCLNAYLEISTGTCKDDPEVKANLYSGPGH